MQVLCWLINDLGVLNFRNWFYNEVLGIYTQATSKCRIQLGLETPLGEALVEDNSYSIVKINNDG